MQHAMPLKVILIFVFEKNANKWATFLLKGTDQAGTFMSLKFVVYYANYRSWQQSTKIQVVS